VGEVGLGLLAGLLIFTFVVMLFSTAEEKTSKPVPPPWMAGNQRCDQAFYHNLLPYLIPPLPLALQRKKYNSTF
jgi:hypothetical protein